MQVYKELQPERFLAKNRLLVNQAEWLLMKENCRKSPLFGISTVYQYGKVSCLLRNFMAITAKKEVVNPRDMLIRKAAAITIPSTKLWKASPRRMRDGSTVNFTTLNVAMSPYDKFFRGEKRDHSYKHC